MFDHAAFVERCKFQWNAADKMPITLTLGEIFGHVENLCERTFRRGRWGCLGKKCWTCCWTRKVTSHAGKVNPHQATGHATAATGGRLSAYQHQEHVAAALAGRARIPKPLLGAGQKLPGIEPRTQPPTHEELRG